MRLKEYFIKMEELNEKNLRIELNKTKKECYKNCYQLCEEIDWDAKLLEKMATEEEVAVSTILKHAEIYALDYLNMSVGSYLKKHRQYLETSDTYVEKNKDDSKKNDNFNRPINVLFRTLRELDIEKDRDKIIELIKNSGFDVGYLRTQAFDHVMVYFPDEKDTLIDDLRAKIAFYIKYAKDKRKKEQLVEEQLQKESRKNRLLTVIPYIKAFVESNTNRKKDFCVKEGINIEDFDEAVELVKEFDNELYQKYLNKIDAQRTERFVNITTKIKDMIDKIENGIMEDDNTKRAFDLIDYYQTTIMDFNELTRVAQKILPADSLKVLRTFIAKNRDYIYAKPSCINAILTGNYEVGCKKDERGFPIPGTGRMITLEEKEFMIDYLKKWNIPINNKTYNLVQTRYLKGKLNNEDNLNEGKTR